MVDERLIDDDDISAGNDGVDLRNCARVELLIDFAPPSNVLVHERRGRGRSVKLDSQAVRRNVGNRDLRLSACEGRPGRGVEPPESVAASGRRDGQRHRHRDVGALLDDGSHDDFHVVWHRRVKRVSHNARRLRAQASRENIAVGVNVSNDDDLFARGTAERGIDEGVLNRRKGIEGLLDGVAPIAASRYRLQAIENAVALSHVGLVIDGTRERRVDTDLRLGLDVRRRRDEADGVSCGKIAIAAGVDGRNGQIGLIGNADKNSVDFASFAVGQDKLIAVKVRQESGRLNRHDDGAS